MAKILIIDDNEQMRWLIRTALEQTAHEVVEADEGGKGILLFQQQQVDLVLCDVYMPGVEGLETIRRLRQLDPAVKIISMSGGRPSIPLDVLAIASQLGAARTLPKPFTMDQLLRVIQEVLA